MKKICQSIVILMIMLFGINYVKAEEIGVSYSTVSCGIVDDIPAALPILFKNVINIVKIAVPIILIIMGMLDFGKAVTSQDEKGMKESQTRFVKRIIGAICVFLVITIVQFVFRLINVDDSNNILACIDCFVNNDCHKYTVVEAACYQCSSDTDKYIWSTNPGTTSACSGGYVKVDLSEKECKGKYIEKKCYQCNSNENVYKWGMDNVADSACPSGYHERSDITEAVSCRYVENKCYQCNSSENVYKWDTSNVADSACPSGYHERSDISAQSACHS